MIGAATLALATPAWAQTADETQPQVANQGAPVDETGREIVVTGTRRLDRSVTDSASPIDVVSSQDLQASPTANMLETLKNIVPSFFVGQNTISDASTFVRPPSLRGLPPDEVLVMINGKRFNRSALVQVFSGGESGLAFGSHGSDISSIPALGIKNLQILREGATAQYGSDAIAGVLNYGLRDDAGYELVGRYGQFYEGDGKSYQIAGNAGFRFGESAFINLTGEYYDEGQTSRGETRPVSVIFARENPDLADQLPHFPLPSQIWGNSPAHGYKFMLNSGFDVTDNVQVYAFGNLAHNEADQSFNHRSSLFGFTGRRKVQWNRYPDRPSDWPGILPASLLYDALPAGECDMPHGRFCARRQHVLYELDLPGGLHAPLRRRHRPDLRHGRREGINRGVPLGFVADNGAQQARPVDVQFDQPFIRT